MLEDATMRAWCLELAGAARVQHIEAGGRPYLDRYFLAGWNPDQRRGAGALEHGLYLHHFRASDPADQVHSHPWGWAVSLILAGAYREERCLTAGARTWRIEHEYRPGSINLIAPDDKHRIELLTHDCWTLFLVGPYAQAWGFSPRC